MDDLAKRTPERHELGDLDQALWQVNDKGEPMDPWKRVAQLSLVRVKDGTPLIFETPAPSAIIEVEKLVEKIRWLGRGKSGANPVIITGTQQVRNPKKNQTWWIPTFTIIRWNEPDGTVLPPDPEPQQMPGTEATPAVKPPPEAMYAVAGPPAALRERKPRNAYAGVRAKQSRKSRSALEDDLDDKIPY